MFLNTRKHITVLIVVDKILILHAVNKNGIRISLLFFFFSCADSVTNLTLFGLGREGVGGGGWQKVPTLSLNANNVSNI